MAQVKIGSSFFKKAKQDYYNWSEAWVREVFQNAVDSGATNISFNYEQISENEINAVVQDNGCGMTLDTLTNKLLSLGESGKNFEGSVGGFGKAKEILFFSQNKYEIKTFHVSDSKIHVVSGSGGEYEITSSENEDNWAGTKVEVCLDVDVYSPLERFLKHTRQAVLRSSFPGKVFINNQEFTDRTLTTKKVREFSFGNIFECKSNSNKHNGILIRVKGSPMFLHYISELENDLVLELNNGTNETLTSNRDQLSNKISIEFTEFAEHLTIDKKSALIQAAKKMTLFVGKNSLQRLESASINSLTRSEYIKETTSSSGSKPIFTASNEAASISSSRNNDVNDINIDDKMKFDVNEGKVQEAEIEYSETEESFLQYVSVAEKIPERWMVTSQAKNVKWLLSAWRVAIEECFKLSQTETIKFLSGFVFEEEKEAIHSSQENGNLHAFLVNPVLPGFKMKFRKTKESCCELIAIAAHEFVHIENRYHDERFSSSYTDLMKKVLSRANEIVKRMLESEKSV